jgi:ubiquinone/menaquinone biosynthesis C-methylase UbiE
MGKLFSKVYDTLMHPLEQKGFAEIRKNLIQHAQGEVLEIGSGTGLNFPFYEQAEKVFAIEPEPSMRDRSLSRAKQACVPIDVVLAGAEELPFKDNSFDTVVGTLVLCTIPNPLMALEEVKRVCKSDGKILFLEHVKLDRPLLGRMQDWLTPIWKHLCDGCHLNRNTLEMVNHAGFKVVRINRYYKNIFVEIEAVNNK